MGTVTVVTMTDEQRDAFLRETRIGTLCTLNDDGSPNALPLWYDWVEDATFEVVVKN